LFEVQKTRFIDIITINGYPLAVGTALFLSLFFLRLLMEKNEQEITLQKGDALIIVDLQNDFLPGGSLAVPQGDEVVPAMNAYIKAARNNKLPVFATRDWHPPHHSSFQEKSGPWPPHCIAETEGAKFADDLELPPEAIIISKAEEMETDAYSGFEGTDLDAQLKSLGVKRLLIGGLATDYCVLNTVRDAIKLGYTVLFLDDASRAVNVKPDDGEKAVNEMTDSGAITVNTNDLQSSL
jgi:nicotinamidase/pyrazinamidase